MLRAQLIRAAGLKLSPVIFCIISNDEHHKLALKYENSHGFSVHVIPVFTQIRIRYF